MPGHSTIRVHAGEVAAYFALRILFSIGAKAFLLHV